MAIRSLILDVNPNAFPYKEGEDLDESIVHAYHDLTERNDHAARNWLNLNVIGVDAIPV